MNLDFDHLLPKLAGLAGAAVSLRFVQGSWPERITMALGGFVVSVYWGQWLSANTGLPEGGAGFLLGLFGMAICDKIWQAIQLVPIKESWAAVLEWLKRKLG